MIAAHPSAVPAGNPDLLSLQQSSAFNAAFADTSTSAATSTDAAQATASDVPDCLSLSPEGLMAYCQSRLQSLDGQMTGIFSSQQTNAKVTQDLNAIASQLSALPSPSSSSSTSITISAANAAAIEAAYTRAINDAGPTSSIGEQLTTDLGTFQTAAQGGTISTDKASLLTQNLKNYTGDLNSDSELTMINLQSLMSQRQTAVQLTTNLVQSLGQQTSDIAKNIGG